MPLQYNGATVQLVQHRDVTLDELTVGGTRVWPTGINYSYDASTLTLLLSEVGSGGQITKYRWNAVQQKMEVTG